MKASINGIDVIISRTGYSSEVGFEIYILGYERGDELYETIMQAGKPFELAPGSPNRIRRIEGGVLDYGSDILVDNNPLELVMELLIDFDKPDFIGKMALQKIRDDGVTRKMVGVFMDGEIFQKNNEHRWTVYDNSKKVGQVTSAVYSPRLERNIGFALLDIAYDTIGTELVVDTPEGRRNLSVTSIPFIDPEKKIPRQSLRD
jgi:aminomethyltransferase